MKTLFTATLAFAIGVTAANLRAQSQAVVTNAPTPCAQWNPDKITCQTPTPTIDDASVSIGAAWAMGFYPTPDGLSVVGKNNQPGAARVIRVDAQGRVECAR